jgi:hypothetical protein
MAGQPLPQSHGAYSEIAPCGPRTTWPVGFDHDGVAYGLRAGATAPVLSNRCAVGVPEAGLASVETSLFANVVAHATNAETPSAVAAAIRMVLILLAPCSSNRSRCGATAVMMDRSDVDGSVTASVCWWSIARPKLCAPAMSLRACS